MKYIITPKTITIIIKNKPVIIGSDNEKYQLIKEALEEGKLEYEVEYILNPQDVDEAKKLLQDPLYKEKGHI